MVSIRSERECGVRIRGSALPTAGTPVRALLGAGAPRRVSLRAFYGVRILRSAARIVLYAMKREVVGGREASVALSSRSNRSASAGGMVSIRSERDYRVRIRGSALPTVRTPHGAYSPRRSLPAAGAPRRVPLRGFYGVRILRSAARIVLYAMKRKAVAGAKRGVPASRRPLRFCRRMVSIRSERDYRVRIRGSALPTVRTPHGAYSPRRSLPAAGAPRRVPLRGFYGVRILRSAARIVFVR